MARSVQTPTDLLHPKGSVSDGQHSQVAYRLQITLASLDLMRYVECSYPHRGIQTFSLPDKFKYISECLHVTISAGDEVIGR